MVNAPNFGKLPKEKFTEAIIFAGADAWSHAKGWEEGLGKTIAADVTPPIYLGTKHLSELGRLRIVDDGRRAARVYLAGEIEPIKINAIAEKLALAGVQDAKLYKGIPDSEPEDWTDYLARLRSEKEKGEPTAVEILSSGKNDVSPALNQMGPSQRGEVLADYYDNQLAIESDSDIVHHYNGVVWVPVQDKELERVMASIFIRSGIAYSKASAKNAVDTMKLSLPKMERPGRNLIGFRNGVFDTSAGVFRQHNKKDWLLIASEVDFCQPAKGETLASHAPNFWSWLQHSTAGNKNKVDRLLAALFMVLANRYDWQLFLEVTGPGGSGKSVMAEICTMLAGKGNTVSASMAALENPRERALVVGYSLIILPDMTRYAGDGAGIKAITGGDRVSIDPKHKAPYSIRIPAVVLAVNNNAMTFSDRSGGISRRRVIFNFSEVVSEDKRDPMLVEKIEAELPVIIRNLLTRFADQNDARRLLAEQRKSEEALAIKREGDSLVDFCGYLMSLMECEGMIVGNAEMVPFSPRRYLYHSYIAYMSAHGLGKPVSLTRFGSDMPGAMAEFGKEYKRKQCTRGADKGRTISNILLGEDAEAWLPAATGLGDGND
ncbi:DNA primase [Lelliottia amnigena]|uniref:DNA primase n=1 Tax=Lelliottia amnigena TaxID=61646 RepID=A0AAP2AGE6_LELAM|nr:DNA primase [Lelliottia amnigena]MBL5936348.1 DNA primase [Lelliottia amnigena]